MAEFTLADLLANLLRDHGPAPVSDLEQHLLRRLTLDEALRERVDFAYRYDAIAATLAEDDRFELAPGSVSKWRLSSGR